VKSYGSDKVSFRQGKLTAVNEQANTITIETPGGSSDTVAYDALILCTGSNYCGPWRDGSDKMSPMETRHEEWKAAAEKVKNASSVLCVGAGAVGIESATYIKEAYGQTKTVGVCLRGNVLLAQLQGAHAMADKMLKEMDVKVHYGVNYQEGQKLEIPGSQYDCILDCRGFKYVGPSQYLQGDLAACVDKLTGQILVNDCGQVTNMHPLTKVGQPPSPTVHSNIFSMGDVCLTHANEMKTIVSIHQYGY
jgi:thioredoxin reductase